MPDNPNPVKSKHLHLLEIKYSLWIRICANLKLHRDSVL